jgi:hypothetical protein
MIVDDVISLVTYSFLLNTAAINQGDHCIVAICRDPAHPEVDFGNQSIQHNHDICLEMKKRLESQIVDILKNFGP